MELEIDALYPEDEDEIVERLARVLKNSRTRAGSTPSKDEKAFERTRVGSGSRKMEKAFDHLACSPLVSKNSSDLSRSIESTPKHAWLATRSEPTDKQQHVSVDIERKVSLERLYAASRARQRSLDKKQTSNLARELRELRFEPELRAKKRDVAGRKSLITAQAMRHSRFQACMRKARERSRDAEVAECTFSPKLAARAKSTALLRRSRQSDKRSTADLFAFADEARLRRAQRKQVADQHEIADLTFSPALNRKSLEIAGKVTSRRLCPETRRGVVTPRRNPDAHSYKPTISDRAKRYKPRRPETDVHDRLYAMAKERLANRHNDVVSALQAAVALPDNALMAWEKTPVVYTPGETKAPWITPPNKHAKRDKQVQFAVVEYSDELYDLLRLISTSNRRVEHPAIFPLNGPPSKATHAPAPPSPRIAESQTHQFEVSGAPTPPPTVGMTVPKTSCQPTNAYMVAANAVLDDDNFF